MQSLEVLAFPKKWSGSPLVGERKPRAVQQDGEERSCCLQ